MQTVRNGLHRLIHHLAGIPDRLRTRAALRRLDARQLEDIGLAPYQIDDVVAGRSERPARPAPRPRLPVAARPVCCPAE